MPGSTSWPQPKDARELLSEYEDRSVIVKDRESHIQTSGVGTRDQSLQDTILGIIPKNKRWVDIEGLRLDPPTTMGGDTNPAGTNEKGNLTTIRSQKCIIMCPSVAPFDQTASTVHELDRLQEEDPTAPDLAFTFEDPDKGCYTVIQGSRLENPPELAIGVLGKETAENFDWYGNTPVGYHRRKR
jgi:hypothetical protein